MQNQSHCLPMLVLRGLVNHLKRPICTDHKAPEPLPSPKTPAASHLEIHPNVFRLLTLGLAKFPSARLFPKTLPTSGVLSRLSLVASL